jgi:hypothetical protein
VATSARFRRSATAITEASVVPSGMTVTIFLLGLLIAILGGGALCAGYLRKEIAADIGPSLGRVQMQPENLDAEVDLVLATRLAELIYKFRHRPGQY